MFSGNGFAQPTWLNGSAEEMLKAFFENEDGNGDGRVTKEEFKGSDNVTNHYEIGIGPFKYQDPDTIFLHSWGRYCG